MRRACECLQGVSDVDLDGLVSIPSENDVQIVAEGSVGGAKVRTLNAPPAQEPLQGASRDAIRTDAHGVARRIRRPRRPEWSEPPRGLPSDDSEELLASSKTAEKEIGTQVMPNSATQMAANATQQRQLCMALLDSSNALLDMSTAQLRQADQTINRMQQQIDRQDLQIDSLVAACVQFLKTTTEEPTTVERGRTELAQASDNAGARRRLFDDGSAQVQHEAEVETGEAVQGELAGVRAWDQWLRRWQQGLRRGWARQLLQSAVRRRLAVRRVARIRESTPNGGWWVQQAARLVQTWSPAGGHSWSSTVEVIDLGAEEWGGEVESQHAERVREIAWVQECMPGRMRRQRRIASERRQKHLHDQAIREPSRDFLIRHWDQHRHREQESSEVQETMRRTKGARTLQVAWRQHIAGRSSRDERSMERAARSRGVRRARAVCRIQVCARQQIARSYIRRLRSERGEICRTAEVATQTEPRRSGGRQRRAYRQMSERRTRSQCRAAMADWPMVWRQGIW